MASIAHKRKEADIFKIVSQVITEEITNANISYPTVTSVRLSPDGSHLFIYLTFDSNELRSLEALEATKGFVRTRIAKSTNTRKAPMLHFELDKTFEEGQKIEEILKKINSK